MTTSLKTFCILASHDQHRSQLEQLIMTEIESVEVRFVKTLAEAEGSVIVLLNALPEPIFSALLTPKIALSAWVLVGVPEYRSELVDEAMMGKVRFVDSLSDEVPLSQALKQAYQFSLQRKYTSLKTITLPKGELLFQEGDRAQAIFILKKGALEVFQFRSGAEKKIGTVYPGEFVGEMAYLNQKPRTAGVRATEASELTEIPLDQVDSALLERPIWSKKMLETLAKRLRELIIY